MTTRSRPYILLAPAALILALGVSGCVGTGEGYSDLSGKADTEIPAPGGLPSNALNGFDVDTIRWVGSSHESNVWLARGQQHPVCFLAYSHSEWISGCGSDGMYSLGRHTYWIVPDGGTAPRGAVPISQNVYGSK